jgi:hypothetical protein
MRPTGRVSTLDPLRSGGEVIESHVAPLDVLLVREPDVDLTDAEADSRIRREALLTLHDLSESWWSGERRRPD